MDNNFSFLSENKDFSSFSTQATEAEKSLIVSASTAAILARRALELAVRWVYINDDDLTIPYQDNISSLIHEDSFKNIIEPSLFPLLKYVIHLGNVAVHTNKNIRRDDAVLSLRNLFEFCKWIVYCYSDTYSDISFDENILYSGKEYKKRSNEIKELYEDISKKDKKLEDMRNENDALRRQMTLLRQKNIENREYSVDEYSESETRKKYIDLQLMEAGWIINVNCIEEVEIEGMPNPSELGRADYVLYGDNGLPLAVVEAKRTSVDSINGSQQAKLYADCFERKYNQRPLIFTTNGFELYFSDDYNDIPRRQVSGFFTKDEMQLYIDRRSIRKKLENIDINDDITNRPYQKEAITAVCDAIENKHRKMLLVQATGSGKTRVSISIVDVLRRHNYVKNVLFLADRIALVKQAKNNYSNLLPDMTLCNLLDNNDNPEQCRMIFSTYPTMMNAIDEKKNDDGSRLFTPGHFDLIIVDESHRSIYKKYQDIFNYFDALILGMTATPKNEIDKNTYGVFDLERGNPTFAYELDKAVEEGYLVDYSTLEYKTKIMEQGIHYNDLSDEEKEDFENTFDDDLVDKDISNSAINEWLFNYDTIDKVLSELMQKGIKVEGGDKLGKTIIFAKNTPHAKAIVEKFKKKFPEYGDSFIKQVDYSIKYSDTIIDEFSTKTKNPQIAVSVDMLDTGIDIPEIVNLVFFKKVKSYSKFWQMIGRGTRLCHDLFGPGIDKEKFLIFDFCGNFEFFGADKKCSVTKIGESLTEKIFNCKIKIARELQAPDYTADEDYVSYRKNLVNSMNRAVVDLNDESFRVKQHQRYVEYFRKLQSWDKLETVEVSNLKDHISPLITSIKENELAKRFDYLIYSIELAELQCKNSSKNKSVVSITAEKLSNMYNIPQIDAKRNYIEKIIRDDFWDNTSIFELDKIREALRELIKFIEKTIKKQYYTNFTDKIIDYKEGTSIYGGNDLKNYKKKVEYYLKEHKDNIAVYKLRMNKKLNTDELKELERILWKELGTKDDYKNEFGETPIGRLVRSIVGVDRETVNAAFSEFLSEEKLNLNQIRFVKLMVEYIVANGNIENNSVLMGEPFRSVGSITALFKDDMLTAKKIMNVAEEILKNSEEIA